VVMGIAALVCGFVGMRLIVNDLSKVKDFSGINLPKIDLPKIPDINAPPPQAPNPTADWKTYESAEGKFSLQYPPAWGVDDQSKTSDSLKNVIFAGSEGMVEISYSGAAAGSCNQTFQKILIDSKSFNVCHTSATDHESWVITTDDKSTNISMLANANKGDKAGQDLIFKILSTLKFTN